MKSSRPKVMHEVGGLPMLGHVLAATAAAGIKHRAVVVGPEANEVGDYLAAAAPEVSVHRQKERLGTAHAVLAARKAISSDIDQVIVLYGDTPLVTAPTLRRLRRRLDSGNDLVVMGFRPEDPARYGRLIMEGRRLVAIREYAEATSDERQIGFCNGGIMGFAAKGMLKLLRAIDNDNAKGEYYLTDAVEIANLRNAKVTALDVEVEEVMGVNSRAELAAAEGVFQRRARTRAMASGVTMIAPEMVFLSHDTKLGRDVLIEPNVFFGPGVSVGEGASILANSHIVGTSIGPGAAIGPFARLRPGAVIGAKAKAGNFVEVKNATVHDGAKVNHLTYVGDATVGARANIGAGTIVCNYDGFAKHHTEIGEGAFIGSNSALVAPVSIGDGAFVATGSVITRGVPDDAMAVARARQVEKPGWARNYRDMHQKRAGNRIERKKR